MSLSASGAATRFCQHVFPFLSDFQPHDVAPETVLRFQFYLGTNRWWPGRSLMPAAQRAQTRDDSVAWHESLFRCPAATIILQLTAVEEDVAAEVDWDETAMVVRVVCYLKRIVRPLGAYLHEVVEGAKRKGLLRRAVAASVQVCIVDTLTGPTSEISRIIRHRRVTHSDDQH